MKKIILILLFANFFAYSNKISGIFSTTHSYSDNILKTSLNGSDIINYGNLDLFYNREKSNHNYSYSLSMLHFDSLFANDFLINSFSYKYIKPFKKKKDNLLSAGASLSIKSGINENNSYDYFELYSFVSTLFRRDQSHWKLNYNYKIKNYRYLPEYSHTRHEFNLKTGHSFNSGTTIIFKNSIGLKLFNADSEYSSSGGGRGRLSHMNSSTSSILTAQEAFSIRVSQSISSFAGVYIQYRRQISILNEINSYNLEAIALEEDLFDDPYAYESNAFTSRITLLLPVKFKLKIYGFYSTRNYLTEYANISESDTSATGNIREDTRKGIDITFAKPFHFNKSFFSAITPSIYYLFLNSNSNSYLYNFNENSFGLEININF